MGLVNFTLIDSYVTAFKVTLSFTNYVRVTIRRVKLVIQRDRFTIILVSFTNLYW